MTNSIEVTGVGFEQENRLKNMQIINRAETETLKIFAEFITLKKEKKLQNNWGKLKKMM